MFSYIGPGIGIGTVILILIILSIVFLSFAFILWIPIKNFFRNIIRKVKK